MSEKTSMFELLKERLTEKEIIKITSDYDLKFCKLEEENKQLKTQLQQEKNKIKEAREYIEKASYFQGNKVLNEKELLEILDRK